MTVRGSKQLPVPAYLNRFRSGDSFTWLVSQYGSRSSDRLTTEQQRNIADSQIVPQACRATLKHLVSGLDWHLADDPEEGKDVKGSKEGDHYYDVLENPLDSQGNPITFADWLDLGADDLLTAKQGWCGEIIRDNKGVVHHLVSVDAATIQFTGNPKWPVYQHTPTGEKSPAWEADRFFQIRWHPSPRWGAELISRSPIQLAYTAIAILASSDTYNFKLITEPIPAGVLNLGPGFTREKAEQWKATWDRGMVGINPEPLALLYGTVNEKYTPFRPPPKDMAFESSFHWYASLVAACFEISILDISILTRVSTQAAAEMQSEATKRQGLRHLMRKVKTGLERHVLPEGMFFIWQDIDPTDEKAEAEVAKIQAEILTNLKTAGFISAEQGFRESQRLKLLDEGLKFEGGESALGLPEGAHPSNVQSLVDALDGGGTLVEAPDGGGNVEELARYLQKAQGSIVDLVARQAAQSFVADPPPDDFWEVSEEYMDELRARMEDRMGETEPQEMG